MSKKFIPPEGARKFKAKGRIGNKNFSEIIWVEPNKIPDSPMRCGHKRIHCVIEESLVGDLRKAAKKRLRDNPQFHSLNVCACNGKLIGGKP